MTKTNTRGTTVFMYHDVRDVDEDFFPKRYNLSSFLTTSVFRKHIQFLKKNYNLISTSDFLYSKNEKREFPPMAALLTFDDGLRDHYNNVLPILLKNNITATFFVPSEPITESVVAKDHKIQFILAGAEEEKHVVDDIFNYLQQKNKSGVWNAYSKSRLGSKNEWTEEMVFITNFLRKWPNTGERSDIINFLFKKYVSADEKGFAKNFYLNTNQVKEMSEYNMIIGGHGHTQTSLVTCGYDTQKREIEKSAEFIKNTIGEKPDLYFSYPNGSYNKDTIQILQEKGFKMAFAVKNKLATMSDNVFEIPRIDATKELKFIT